MMRNLLLLVLVLLLGLSVSGAAAALDNTHMGSKANAMGKAFTGLADDPSAVFFNPAGLVFQREGVSIQAYGLGVFTELNYTAAQILAPTSTKQNTSDETVLFPGFFLNYHKENIALGLGLYVPFGGGKYKYEDFRGVPGFSIEQSLGLTAFGGSLAIKLAPKFSMGISLFGYAGMYSYKKSVPAAYTGALGASQEDDLSSIAAVGGNIGFMYVASDKWQFGATVKLPVRITVNGETTFGTTTYDSAAELRLPFYVTLGTAWKASPDLTLTFDFNYAIYSTMNKYSFLFRGYPDATGTIKDVGTGYTDATYFALGADWKATDKLSLRGGATFTPHATLDKGISLSCDVSHLTLALGVAYKVLPEVELCLSAHKLIGFERTVNGTTGVTGATGEQTFDKDVMMVMFGVNLNL